MPPKLLLIVLIAVIADFFGLVWEDNSRLPFLETVLQENDSRVSALSFPEKFVVTKSGKLYILDTELSKVFYSANGLSLETRCRREIPKYISDFSVDAKGNIWTMSASSKKITGFDPQCKTLASFSLNEDPLRLETNSFGELILLSGTGKDLFRIYSPNGKLLRSFGERRLYNDKIKNFELSDGRIVADRKGGFFFSFNYPPLIRHYANNGSLIDEFEVPLNVKILPPKITAEKQGNRLAVTSIYQVGVLDMAIDSQNRLYLLISGQNKAQALTYGCRKLMVMSSKGKVLNEYSLDNSFHSLSLSSNAIYLLRKRDGIELSKYSIP